MQYIPYDPQTDPKQYLAQALQQGVTGFLAQRQKQQFQKGLSPTMTPMQLFQKALTAGYDPQTAMEMTRMIPQTQGQGFTLGAGQTRFDPQGRQIATGAPKVTPPKRYDVKTLNETLWEYTHEEVEDEIREKEPSKNDLFTLRQMAKTSGYRLRRMTTEQLERKKHWLKPWFLEGKEKVKKTHWVLEDAQGNLIRPEPPAEGGVAAGMPSLIPFETSAKAQSAPAIELNQYWPKMSMDEKKTAWEYLEGKEGTEWDEAIKRLIGLLNE